MTFGFPWYLSIIPALIAGLLLLIATFTWNRIRSLAVIVGLFGLLIGVLFGPMLFLDRVSVDQQRLMQRTGLWFAPTTKGFELEQVRRIHITSGRDLKGRVIEVWIADLKDGTEQRVDPGDLWERNGLLIAGFLELEGIPVVREP
jgi:hypothetical protein